MPLIAWEYLVRRRWGDGPAADEYLARFPEIAGEALREALQRVETELAGEVAAWPASDVPGPSAKPAPGESTPPPAELAAEPATTTALFAVLRTTGLLSTGQLNELMLAEARGGFADAAALAQELVQRDWLTSYQAHQLLLGRGAQLVLGKYVLLERLGQGGIGTVFKARHLQMQRLAALKVIRRELVLDDEVVKRFYREIQLISRIRHPNVVHPFDAGPCGDTHMLVMEHIEGLDLARLVSEQGPLPVERARDYVRQVAAGLQHIHENGLVHRDIKPGNLMVTHAPGSPSPGVVKILDLGLARLGRRTEDSSPPPADGTSTALTLAKDLVMMGTPDYLAPEQALDFHGADIRADIYSLGCTLFYLLTGQPPFAGGTVPQKLVRHQQAAPPAIEEFRADVPAELRAALYRMLAKRPEERFQTPAELAAALTDEPPPAVAGPVLLPAEPTAETIPDLPALVEPIRTGDTTPESKGPGPFADNMSVHRPGKHRPRAWLLLAGAPAAALIAFVLVLVMTGQPPTSRAAKTSRNPPPAVAIVPPTTPRARPESKPAPKVYSVVLQVGPSKQFATPSQAAAAAPDGALIEIEAGTYAGDVAVWRAHNLTLRGVGGRPHLQAKSNSADGKAIWHITGNNATVENLEFSGARAPEPANRLCGIRAAGVGLTVRTCAFHDNDMAIWVASPSRGNVVIEHSLFADNGKNHLNGGAASAIAVYDVENCTIRACSIRRTRSGDSIRIAARTCYVLYNRILDEQTGSSSYAVHLASGGIAYVVGNVMHKGPKTENGTFVHHSSSEAAGVAHELYVVNNTLVTERTASPFVRAGVAAPVRLLNNIFRGKGHILDGKGEQQSNLTEPDPRFVNPAEFDYRLQAGSPAVGQGTPPGAAHGFDLTPRFQPLPDARCEPRPGAGRLAIGAYEPTSAK